MSTAPQIPGYALTGRLGAGATATVWRGHRLADALPVAVKVIEPVGGRVAEALREAGLLAQVRHQHVIHLYDVLPLPDADAGQPAVALVTQLAGGGSLAQVLTRRRLLSPGELVTVLQPLAGALADLHQRGVVHGDVSTGNIVFREDGMPLLADLGTARIAGEDRLRGVGTGAGDGMVAPEVVEGFPATRESDVYQLGALARLCLVGEVPGPGFDRQALAQVAPELPELLVDLVERCMAGAPEDRPDAEELAVALHAVASPEPVEVAPDADSAHGLTQRLRQVAQEDEAARGACGQPGAQPGAHRPERFDPDASTVPPTRSVRDRMLRPTPRARALLGLVVGTLVLVMLVGVGWSVARSWWPEGAAEEAAGAQVVDPPGETVAAVPGEAVTEGLGEAPTAGAGEAVMSGAEGLSSDGTRQVLQDLVDARALAWEATDPGLLSGALAAGSPAHRDERALLSRAREAGISYPHVGFEVQDLVVAQEAADRLLVKATVVREPLEARDMSGWLLRTPTRTERVVLELVQQEGRWLLWSWSEAGDPEAEEPTT